MSYYQEEDYQGEDSIDPKSNKYAEHPQEETAYYLEPYKYDATSTGSSSKNDATYEPFDRADWDNSNVSEKEENALQVEY